MILKAKDIIGNLEKKYPKANAESWDNVGLIVGKLNQEVRKVQLSLDATDKAIENAIKNGAELIITHHPMIFKPVKTITTMDNLGRKIIKIIENNRSLYAMHTNLDSSKNGLNDYILNLLGVENSKVIDVNEFDSEVGIGRLYTLSKELSIDEYATFVKNSLKIKNIRIISENREKTIKKIALINGSGMSYWRKVKSLGADLFITGDIGYHDALDAKEAGINVFDIGHFESENCFVELLRKDIEGMGIEVITFNDGPVFEIY
ncbi:Nif3-like dinuclear metal center hexameric protein [uncultured Fusobacterium sp.]|uniref:Nif3-like dinuclear metal center hexameric protein n=1 Tax=uncultured Fusobacterium sp. TaxID=159267 RepID=UPI0025F204FC|nr:Nif3-like dinuclear metal center hexameric protein [uncultured Fusobacterium sp.]